MSYHGTYYIVGTVVTLLIITVGNYFPTCESLRIGITHVNDVGGQIESFERGTFQTGAPTPCSQQAESAFQCTGGLLSLTHWLNDSTVYGSEVLSGNILRLSSGNLIGGESGWISSTDGGWESYGELVKEHFRPHVTTLGIKEFEAGLERTVDYMHGLGSGRVTLANTCYQNHSSVYGKEEVMFCEEYDIHQRIRIVNFMDPVKYIQFKVGIIGFINPIVERLSLPGKLKFTPIVPSIQEVVQNHKSEINTFIAIGDGSMSIAKEILDKIPQVKLVIYGNAYNKDDGNVASKYYPVVYKQGYIATAGPYGSSIGNLLFELDTEAEAFHLVPGRSKLVETVRPKIWNAAAKNAQVDYAKLEAQIRQMKETVVGQSRVHLQGGTVCWRQECNFGNLVADAMVHCALQVPSKPFDFNLHAIWHARALFESNVTAGANISQFDIHKWLPYHNQVHLVSVSGRDLRRIFEASAASLISGDRTLDCGQLLQVSNGLEIYYNLKTANQVHVRMTLDQNGAPQLDNITDHLDYYLVIPTFLYEGRGVYEFAREKGFWKDVIFDNITSSNLTFDDDCVEGYIRALGQVSVGFEKRIWIDENSSGRFAYSSGVETGLTVTLTIIIFSICQAALYAGYKYAVPFLRQRFHGDSLEYLPNQI